MKKSLLNRILSIYLNYFIIVNLFIKIICSFRLLLGNLSFFFSLSLYIFVDASTVVALLFLKESARFINGPRHAKTCLMPYANNKGADQPAHPQG